MCEWNLPKFSLQYILRFLYFVMFLIVQNSHFDPFIAETAHHF